MSDAPKQTPIVPEKPGFWKRFGNKVGTFVGEILGTYLSNPNR